MSHNLDWRFTDWHCPACGKKTVVELPGVDEDNAGNQHICYRCRFGFMHQGDYTDLYPEEVDKVISDVLRKFKEIENDTIDKKQD